MEWKSNVTLKENITQTNIECRKEELNPRVTGYIRRGKKLAILKHEKSRAATSLRLLCGLEELPMLKGWIVQSIPIQNEDYVEVTQPTNPVSRTNPRFRGTFFELYPDAEV